jgi:hypothetical protein
MAGCLARAGLPAVVEQRPDDQQEVKLDTDQPYLGCFADAAAGCALGLGGSDDPAVEKDMTVFEYGLEDRADGGPAMVIRAPAGLALPATLPAGGFLIVGATDHTEAWTACLAETGYTNPPPEIQIDRDEELRDKEAIVEATLAWADCARREGLAVQDPEPPAADGWQTRPAALIDAGISAADLRAVLRACPNFDADAHTADLAAQRQDDYDPALAVVDPEILLDAPGWRDGELPEAGAAEWTPERQALWDELTAANKAFWDAQGSLG